MIATRDGDLMGEQADARSPRWRGRLDLEQPDVYRNQFQAIRAEEKNIANVWSRSPGSIERDAVPRR